MSVYLLDINVLLALNDPTHAHHYVAHHWFENRDYHAWATCPLTENGFVRIASHPRYPNYPGDMEIVMTMLRTLCTIDGHRFWAENISLRDIIGPNYNISSKQITDIYLLGLAIHNGGKLATLDQRIPVNLLPNSVDSLEIITI